MMLIAGTIPAKDVPLVTSRVSVEGEYLAVDGYRIPCAQGTGAMVRAALEAAGYLGLEPPRVLLAEDIGQGKGSRQVYEYLIRNIVGLSPEVLALHYCLPDMALTRGLCEAVKKCPERPVMVADAASMYAAKASGLAAEFDVFTPDAAEMAFLADPEATHPAYIARHLFDTDTARIPDLVADAYRNNSAARLLLVKGATDYVVCEGEVIETITEPDLPVLEAIGGTSDTLTGLVAAFIYAGLEPHEAAIIAARANRVAGEMAKATPQTRIGQIIAHFPAVFEKYLCEWSGVCYSKGGKNND